MLFLSEGDIRALDLSPALLRGALAEAFRLHAAGQTAGLPKAALPLGAGSFVQSMAAVAPDLGHAAHKWVGVAPENAARGLPRISSLVTLTDTMTGRPVAVLAADHLTALRTAAMSALAGEHLARPGSRSIGFVGGGVQAHAHLAAFTALLPGLTEAVCASGGQASAERLAAAAEAAGLRARIAVDPAEALACDVVVTTVPVDDTRAPFLDPAALQPGCFVAAVDLGRSFRPERLRDLDILAVDDRAQAAEPKTRARLAYPGPFDADLSALVSGAAAGRTGERQRAMFLFPGFALADLAVALAIVTAARPASVGRDLAD